MIARLQPGATLANVRSQLDQVVSTISTKVSRPLRQVFARNHWDLLARHYRTVLLGNRTPLLLILQGFVLLLLIMTCVNVANLLLARILGRTHELAMRAALGASRWVLARQLFMEGLCLAVPGGLAGIGLGWWGLMLIQGIGLGAHLGVFSLTPDWRVGLFALGVVVLVAVVISLLPIRHLSRTDLQSLLQEGGRGMAGGRGARRVRKAMVVAELALATAILGGTGLLVNSFVRLQSIDPGFDASHVLTADILIPSRDQRDDAARRHTYEELLRRVRALPGVTDAGVTGSVPIKTGYGGNAYAIPGVSPTGGHQPLGNLAVATRGFFKTLHIPLLRGRLFGPQDGTADSQPVVVIDKYMAEQWFHGKNPVGYQMMVGGMGSIKFTIIGVVATIRDASLDKAAVRGTFYLDGLQVPSDVGSIVIKTSVPPYGLAQPVKQTMAQIDPLVSISDFASMDDVLAQSLVERKALMVLVLLFACIGLALAAVGAYGLLSYVVSQRVTECGVRLALGALPSDLSWLIIGDGLRMLAVGLCLGLGLAVVLGYAISSQLFDVAPFDLLTLLGVSIALSIITLTACWLPARRAAKLDPAVAITSNK